MLRQRRQQDSPPSKALTHGLAILQHLTASGRPQTSTEIATALGMHQSSASRILRTLMAAGFVRKPDYHSFAADYGALTLGAASLRHFAIAQRPRQILADLAGAHPGLMVALVKLWRGELLYFLRSKVGDEPIPVTFGYPLHLSSPALRLLVDKPREEALAILAGSRGRHGWTQPCLAVPDDEAAVLDHARRHIIHDALVLGDWHQANSVTGAIRLDLPDHEDVALAVAGARADRSDEAIALILQDGRRSVETLMRAKVASATQAGSRS